MSRKKKPLPILEQVVIEACAAEGKSLFHWDDLVVFVPFCVPGDIVDVQIRRKKHSFAEGEVVRFIQYSKVREEPRCKHFGVCGGCKWQNLPYAEQLKMKEQQVKDQLTRIGKIELPEFLPILGSVKQWEYRNKLDFGCANKRYLTKEEIRSGEWRTENGEFATAQNVSAKSFGNLPTDINHSETITTAVANSTLYTLHSSLKSLPAIGFHITGAFDKILPIEKCWLMDDLHNQIRNEIYEFALQNDISFFDLREQVGLLRDVIIRNSNTGEWMVIIQFHLEASPSPSKGGENLWDNEDGKKALALLQFIADKFPQISSLLYLDNQKCNDTIGDQDILVFKGEDHIFETMEDLKFKVGPKSFYQTNTDQAYHLYSVVREFAFNQMENGERRTESLLPQWQTAQVTGAEANSTLYTLHSPLPLIYDLYTGTGTIANFVARKARKVIGIEYVPEAIEDAKVNSQINHIDNTLFFAGDMKDVLNDAFIEEHGRPDIIITDPPRAGMHPDVVQTILRTSPQRIVYVSCNPATQARDLQMLDCDYRVVAVQPVDMFPHTPHVENVVLLEKKCIQK